MLKDIIFLLVPMLFSYIMFVKSRNYELFFKKLNNEESFLKEKLEKIYLPIYIKHVSTILIREKFVVLVGDANAYHYFETVDFVDDTLLKNLNCINAESQKLFLKFHVSLHNFYFIGNKDITPDELSEDELLSRAFNTLDEAYKELYNSLIKEYKHICHKLNLELPIENFD